MAHTPVNHPLRPLYRAVAGLAGLYLVVFGILGALATADAGMFARDTEHVLGQGTNLAWSIVTAVVGVIVLIGVAVGRNVDAAVDQYMGWALLVIGMFLLAVARTDVNVFNVDAVTVSVTFFVGLVLITAGLYSKVAPARHARAENGEGARRSREPARS